VTKAHGNKQAESVFWKNRFVDKTSTSWLKPWSLLSLYFKKPFPNHAEIPPHLKKICLELGWSVVSSDVAFCKKKLLLALINEIYEKIIAILGSLLLWPRLHLLLQGQEQRYENIECWRHNIRWKICPHVFVSVSEPRFDWQPRPRFVPRVVRLAMTIYCVEDQNSRKI